ncbi:hypothetical protein [Caballeronia sordidicola]|uniref:hypothetical protein n=1 Tax=Caballeronia sordidicola TaxID=196367 RepID=UPI002119BF4F|nr:hypothetical protein [Caballeronia sordidicola]
MTGKETPNVLAFDCSDVYGTLAETSRQQPSDDAQSYAPRLRRQAAHVIHVLVVAAQLLIYRCRAVCGHRDDALGAQHHEQMS